MKNVTTLGKWLQRGRQRAAVAGSLRKPMTASEICRAARQTNPHVQLRDIWLIMRQLEEKKLVVCLNPRQTNGKLYSLTDHGREVVAAGFGIVRCDITTVDHLAIGTNPVSALFACFAACSRSSFARVRLNGTIFFSYSSNGGKVTCTFFAYARCTAALLCPEASWAKRSG